MKKFTLAAAAIAGLIASPLLAADLTAEADTDGNAIAAAADETAGGDASNDGASVIVAADLDGNGTYSFEELKSVYPDLTVEDFAKVDANVDGEADTDEIQTALDAAVLAAG